MKELTLMVLKREKKVMVGEEELIKLIVGVLG